MMRGMLGATVSVSVRHRRLVAAVAPPHSPYSLSTRTRIASDKGGRASLDPRALYDVSLDVRLRST